MLNNVKEKSKIVEELNDILAKCYDAEKGYKEAALAANSMNLKSMFKEYAQQRYDFGHEIKREIKSLGGEIDKGGTLAGTLHRAWMDFRASITNNDEIAILNEAIRGENNALDNYRDAMDDIPVTSSVYTTLINQRNQIRTALDRLEKLVPVFEA